MTLKEYKRLKQSTPRKVNAIHKESKSTANLMHYNRAGIERIVLDQLKKDYQRDNNGASFLLMSNDENKDLTRTEEHGYAHLCVSKFSQDDSGFKYYNGTGKDYIYVTSNTILWEGKTLFRIAKEVADALSQSDRFWVLAVDNLGGRGMCLINGYSLLSRRVKVDERLSLSSSLKWLYAFDGSERGKWDISIGWNSKYQVYNEKSNTIPQSSGLEHIDFSFLSTTRYSKYRLQGEGYILSNGSKQKMYPSIPAMVEVINNSLATFGLEKPLNANTLKSRFQRAKGEEVKIGTKGVALRMKKNTRKQEYSQPLDLEEESQLANQLAEKSASSLDSQAIELARQSARQSSEQGNLDNHRATKLAYQLASTKDNPLDSQANKLAEKSASPASCSESQSASPVIDACLQENMSKFHERREIWN